jgi:hypothetical protein
MFREDFGNMKLSVIEPLVKKTIEKFNFPEIKFDFVRILYRDNEPNIIYLTSTPKMIELPGGYKQHHKIYREIYSKLMAVIKSASENTDDWDVRMKYFVNENMKKEEFPFSQIEKDGKKIRTFKKDVDTEELVWHRDREDRLVEVLDGSGWELQFDNELPKKMKPGDVFIIPEGMYHRVKRGGDDLKIMITFLNEKLKIN